MKTCGNTKLEGMKMVWEETSKFKDEQLMVMVVAENCRYKEVEVKETEEEGTFR